MSCPDLNSIEDRFIYTSLDCGIGLGYAWRLYQTIEVVEQWKFSEFKDRYNNLAQWFSNDEDAA